MASKTEAQMELNSSNAAVANRTHFGSSTHYAAHYQYKILDENFLRHLLNLTSIKAETMSHSTDIDDALIYSGPNESGNDTLNYDIDCDVSHDNESAWFSTEFQATLHFMYISVFLIAVFGNGIVCFIVCTSSRMQTVTNYFIANLALSDMLMAMFCIPFSFISLFVLQYWPFGAVLCKIVNYVQAISVLVSAYTLVAISIDRYIAIMFPLKPRVSKRYAKCIIVIVWGIALATASPIAVKSSLNQPTEWFKNCDRHICQELWDVKEHEYIYSLILMSLQFIIPLVVLVFTYARIAVAVWGKRPPGEAENLRDLRMARSKRKMIKMMLAVVGVFIFCWLPFNCLIFVVSTMLAIFSVTPSLVFFISICRILLGPDESSDPLLPYLWFAFHWLAMSHSCYNPLIYCYMNARFRSGFITVLHRLPGFQKFCAKRFRGGMEENSHLHRMNTSTTYISTRRKQQISQKPPQKTETSCFCAETTLQR